MKSIGAFVGILVLPAACHAGILFLENFDNTSLSSRGWYDNTGLTLSTAVHITGSAASAEFHYLPGATKPTSGGSIRRIFTETDSVYLSYYVKYSSNWQGSNKAYHPHEFMLLTNSDGAWSNLAYTYLTAYIEQNEGEPLISIQDGRNIDETRINMDLTNITEQRAVAGCNGDSDGYGKGTCYLNGSVHWNGKTWRTGKVAFSDIQGQYYKGDWHLVEAYIKLNSIVGGKGVADGIIKYSFDGKLLMEKNNVVVRTGQHPNMKFNQLVLAPYIGDGSPIDQTFWIDNLTLFTSPDTVKPSAPTGLKAQ